MEKIVKDGIVTSVGSDTVNVKIQSCSACHQCAAKGFCGLSETQEREISVATPDAKAYKIGEEVLIGLNGSLGFKAVFYCYAVPLFLLVAAIVLCRILGLSEFSSGICGIFVLIPYYLGVFLLKNKLKSKFLFEISKKTYS